MLIKTPTSLLIYFKNKYPKIVNLINANKKQNQILLSKSKRFSLR